MQVDAVNAQCRLSWIALSGCICSLGMTVSLRHSFQKRGHRELLEECTWPGVESVKDGDV